MNSQIMKTNAVTTTQVAMNASQASQQTNHAAGQLHGPYSTLASVTFTKCLNF